MAFKNRQLNEIILPSDANKWDEAYENSENAISKTNFSRAHGIAITSGTGSNLTATISNFVFADLVGMNVKLHADIADRAGINVNDLGEKPIYTSNDELITAGAKSGSILNLIYNAEKDRFYALGASSQIDIDAGEW